MKLKFHRKRITGILTVLPSREVTFEEEMENYNFSVAKSMKLKMAMGYNKHRIVEEGVCVSDLCVHGLNFLFENRMLRVQLQNTLRVYALAIVERLLVEYLFHL